MMGALGTWRRVRREGSFQVVHFHDPELIPAMAMLALVARGTYFLYDIHEELPLEIASKAYIPRAWKVPLRLLARGAWRLARVAFSGFAPATEAIAGHWPVERTRCVHNYPKALYGEPAGTGTRPDPSRILYIGALTEIRGIRQMLDAVGIVRKARPDVRLEIAGRMTDGSLAPEIAQAVAEGWCLHHPWLAPADLAVFARGAGVGLVPYLPQLDHLEALPTKIFEYMALGVPVLASDFPLWRRLIQDSGAGRVVTPAPAPMAAALLEMLGDQAALAAHAEAGRTAYRHGYRWETEQENLKWHYRQAGLFPEGTTATPVSGTEVQS